MLTVVLVYIIAKGGVYERHTLPIHNASPFACLANGQAQIAENHPGWALKYYRCEGAAQ